MVRVLTEDETSNEFFELVNENDIQEKRITFFYDNSDTIKLLELFDREVDDLAESRRLKKTVLSGARYSNIPIDSRNAHDAFLDSLDLEDVEKSMEDVCFVLEAYRQHNFYPQMIVRARTIYKFMAENANVNRWAYLNFIALLVEAHKEKGLSDFSYVLLHDCVHKLDDLDEDEGALLAWATNLVLGKKCDFTTLNQRAKSLSQIYPGISMPPEGPGLCDAEAIIAVAQRISTFEAIAKEPPPEEDIVQIGNDDPAAARFVKLSLTDRLRIRSINILRKIPPLFWLAKGIRNIVKPASK